MRKTIPLVLTLLSILVLTGCGDSVSNVIKTDGVKEVQKNEAINYSYSKDKSSVIIELKDSSNAEQVTIMQEMLSKGYSLKAVDTTYSDAPDYNPSSVIINMYFQKK